jgi:hypothetical protein
MPRVRFLENFEYKPMPQQTYVYSKGDVVLVTHEIAKKAIANQKAELTEFNAPPAGVNATISKFKNTRKRNNKEKVIALDSLNL